MQDSERRRNDLVDLTVHDIKNWVHTASSALEVLELEPDSVQAMIPIIRHSTRSITTLVTTLQKNSCTVVIATESRRA